MKRIIILMSVAMLTGCVSYKGQPEQIGSYIQDRDFYMRSHFRCTKMGKKIIEANKEYDEKRRKLKEKI